MMFGPRAIVVYQPWLAGYRDPVWEGMTLGAEGHDIVVSVPRGTANMGSTRAEVRYHTELGVTISSRRFNFTPVMCLDALRGRMLVLPWQIDHLSVAIALLLGRVAGARVALWGQATSRSSNRRLYRRLRAWMARLAFVAFTYEEAQAEEVVRDFPVLAGKVHAAPNGVGCTVSNHDSLPAAPTARILYLGRLDSRKRVGVLLQAASRLSSSSGVGWRVDIIGDGPLRKDLEHMADSLGMDQYVRFHGHVADFAEIAEIALSSGGIGVVPDAPGLGVQHLQCLGFPVLTNCSSRLRAPELGYLEPEVNCISARPIPDEMAQTIESLFSSPDRWNRLARAGMAAVNARPDPKDVGAIMARVLLGRTE